MPLRGRRLTVILVAALVAVLVLGGAAAVAISGHQRNTAGSAAARVVLSTPPPADLTPRSTSQRADPGSADAGTVPRGPSSTGAVVSSVSGRSAGTPGGESADPTSAPAGPSTNLTVQMSPSARAHQRSQDVQLLLQGFFDAINQHSYSAWTQSVTGSMESRQTGAQWLQAYATTLDSSIWMASMTDTPLQVELQFTSQQDADLAPKDLPVPCIDWTLTYQLVDEKGRLVIGSTVPGSVTMAKCAG